MNLRSSVFGLLPALAVGFLACSSSPSEPSSTSAGGASSSSDATSSDTSSSGASTGGGGGGLPQAKHVAYLNFNGTVWAPGPDDATARSSELLALGNKPKTAVAGFAAATGSHPDSALRSAIIARATELITKALAPFDVSVTTRRPTIAFTEVVLGGSPEDVGGPLSAAGVAILDCEDENPSNTAIVFADSGTLLIPVEAEGAATTLASVALHELGHTWGLAHTDDVTDIMSPNDSSSLTWGSGAVVGGGSEGKGLCGRTTQDSGALLMMHLGPHVERAEVPVMAAGSGPVVVASTPAAAPEPGLSIGSKLAPCLKLDSSLDVLGAFAETWIESNRWIRFSHSAQMGSASPLFLFDPVDTPPGVPMFERLSVIDSADRVTEVRAWLAPSFDGPVLAPCN